MQTGYIARLPREQRAISGGAALRSTGILYPIIGLSAMEIHLNFHKAGRDPPAKQIKLNKPRRSRGNCGEAQNTACPAAGGPAGPVTPLLRIRSLDRGGPVVRWVHFRAVGSDIPGAPALFLRTDNPLCAWGRGVAPSLPWT